ncbi:hypothetical protein [Saccharopolyspora hattusasensis]|uniref:hypothetical protein n=1 Tax=Saccharopolyspora hattusasensis TaxID=1128679 RepID=UPI003D9965E7
MKIVPLVAGGGKTRLALHVARELQRAFPDGVRLVEPAQLQDPGILVNAMTAALELPDQSAREPLTVLVEFLADKRLLILLDNCEHVLTAAASGPVPVSHHRAPDGARPTADVAGSGGMEFRPVLAGRAGVVGSAAGVRG